MATEFSREFFSENRIVKADLRAAHQLREEDIARIKAEVKKLYDATEVILNVSVDESLLSGYVLQVGDRVFDNSGRHQLDQMMAGKPSLATLKTRIEDYKPAATTAEVISTAKAAAKKSAGTAVKSPLPGVIVDLKVREGDQVKAGQHLLVLEAMKMENNINANKDGKVAEIKVNKGDSVLEGTDLVIIE